MEEKDVIIIVAVVAGSLFIIVMVGLIVFIVVQRRRKRSQSDGARKDAPRSRLHLGLGLGDRSSTEGATGLNRPSNSFDRVVGNNYVTSDILNFDHHMSTATGKSNKVLPPVPPKPKLIPGSNGSFRGKENSGFVSEGKVLPAATDKTRIQLSVSGPSREKETGGLVRESKISPTVPAKPKMKLLSNGSSPRGKDNSGFVSDDSGYTTLDTTVRSADSMLYLRQKLKQDMDNTFKNSPKRIRVTDSDSTGPYAIIDILDLKNRNSRAGASGSVPSAGFLGTRGQTDVTTGKSPQTRENIYFELERQSDISEDDSDSGDGFNVAQSTAASSTEWKVGELQETNV